MTVVAPPSVGTTGQFIESVIVSGSDNRQVITIGNGVSTALATVSSSQGLHVNVTNFTTAGSLTVVSASSGVVQVLTSGTLIAALTSGVVTLSSAPLVVAASSGYLVRSLSSGTVTLSSDPTIVSASSGVVQVLTSGTLIVAMTSGTVTLSSNPTIVSASSGLIQVLTSGTLIVAMTSGTVTLSSAPVVNSASSGVVQVIESTGTAGGVQSTYFLLTSIKGIKATAGRLLGFEAYTTAPLGAWLVFYDFSSANVTVGTSIKGAFPIQGWSTLGGYSTVAVPGFGQFGSPPIQRWWGPNGLDFATAISVAPQISASGAVVSTAAANNVTGVAVTVFYV